MIGGDGRGGEGDGGVGLEGRGEREGLSDGWSRVGWGGG